MHIVGNCVYTYSIPKLIEIVRVVTEISRPLTVMHTDRYTDIQHTDGHIHIQDIQNIHDITYKTYKTYNTYKTYRHTDIHT